MSGLASVVATVHGRVQGVNFRYFVERHASRLELTGYVRNLLGGRELEVRAEGKKENLDELLDYLGSGPPRAKVERVDVEWSDYGGRFGHFGVRY
ncbi:MAG: acylphosphatase [Dehalococcoidia bacterium]